MTEAISAEVRELLRDPVTSFERLEVLLLLQGAPEHPFDAATVSSRVRMPQDTVIAALEALAERQLIDKVQTSTPPTYRFVPTAPHAEAVRALAHAYDEQRAAVMSIMNTNAIERLRSSTIRTFADSFLLRRKKPDG